MEEASKIFAFEKIIRSSGKRRWDMGGLSLEISMPWISPRFSSLSINAKRISDPMIKRKGSRGSPCLRPWVEENFPNGGLSNETEKDVVDRH